MLRDPRSREASVTNDYRGGSRLSDVSPDHDQLG